MSLPLPTSPCQKWCTERKGKEIYVTPLYWLATLVFKTGSHTPVKVWGISRCRRGTWPFASPTVRWSTARRGSPGWDMLIVSVGRRFLHRCTSAARRWRRRSGTQPRRRFGREASAPRAIFLRTCCIASIFAGTFCSGRRCMAAVERTRDSGPDRESNERIGCWGSRACPDADDRARGSECKRWRNRIDRLRLGRTLARTNRIHASACKEFQALPIGAVDLAGASHRDAIRGKPWSHPRFGWYGSKSLNQRPVSHTPRYTYLKSDGISAALDWSEFWCLRAVNCWTPDGSGVTLSYVETDTWW